MTFPEFDTFSEKLLNQVVNMKNSKGKEYANSEDRFANFDRLSERLGVSNTIVGWIYLTKHLDAIESYINHSRTYSGETIQGRIVDAICYLTLIAGMIQEQEDFQEEAGQVEEQPDPPHQPRAENKILWNCHYCEYKTPNKSDLASHEMWHSRHSRCLLCGESYLNTAAYLHKCTK